MAKGLSNTLQLGLKLFNSIVVVGNVGQALGPIAEPDKRKAKNRKKS